MGLIDSHCHASPVWYEPVETLVFQMDRAGVEKAVLIQLLGQADNSYQADCVARFPGRFASVVGLDADAADAPHALARLALAGAKGVRLRPDAPETLWRAASDHGLAVSCIGPASGFLSEGFGATLAKFPTLAIVLEHLGGWARADCDGAETTKAGIWALSRFPNLSLKIPGLGQIAKRSPVLGTQNPLQSGAENILREAVTQFGAHRLMWGSDFPPVAAREGYENALNWPRQALAALNDTDKSRIFGGTAAAIFGL